MLFALATTNACRHFPQWSALWIARSAADVKRTSCGATLQFQLGLQHIPSNRIQKKSVKNRWMTRWPRMISSPFDHISPMQPKFCFKAGRYAFICSSCSEIHICKVGKFGVWTLEIGHGAASTDFSKDRPAVCRESCKIFMNILLCGNHSKAWRSEKAFATFTVLGYVGSRYKLLV